jgi:hypothetical protein
MNNIRTTLGPQHTNILFFIHNYGSISPYYYILLQVQEGFLVDKKSPNCDMYEMSRIFSSGLSFARQSVSPGLRPDEKKNEMVSVKCYLCATSSYLPTVQKVPAIPQKRAAKANPAQPSTKRVMRSRKEPTPQQPTTSEPPAMPSAIAGFRSQHTTTVVVSTSTPIDCAGLPTAMIQFDDWPDMAVNVVNIVITPVITPSDSQLVAAEWSSRCDLPIPVREDTVELRVYALTN